jgi:hypothetical protein
MNISLSEFGIVLFNLIIILAIPAIIVLISIILFRRIRNLEIRVADLESMQDSTVNRTGDLP